MEHYKIYLDPEKMNIETITIDQSIIDKVDIELFGSLEEAKIAKKEMDKSWCKGHKKDYGVNYVDDNVSDICYKHHYTCKKCGKIVQIG